MENNNATIQRGQINTYLVLSVEGQDLKISLTEDNPNEIKSVFNKLLLSLKKGKIKFQLTDTENDLYTHICKEYITQLNTEINGIYKELEGFELLEQKKK